MWCSFLQQLKQYEQQNGKRILDTYDAHYPDTNNHWPKLGVDVDKLRTIVDQTYPGTKISFSEWTMDGTGPLKGALALADELGAFARNRIAWASIWGISDTHAPLTYALRMFRNYNGQGAMYGDTYVGSSSQDATKLAVHSSIRGSDGALVILVINKIGSDQTSTVTIHGFNPKSPAQVYVYGAGNENAIVKNPDLTVGGTFSAKFAAFSLTLVVIPHA